MWVQFYRYDAHLFASTNNGLERMNQTFKHDFLKRRTNYTLSMMLRILVEAYIPTSLRKYAMKNTAALSRMQGYQSMHTPDFLLDKMPSFVEKVKSSFNKAHAEYTPDMINACTGSKRWKVRCYNSNIHVDYST